MPGLTDGSLARRLDFEGESVVGNGQPGLRLAPPSRQLSGPDKYKVLDHRRRQAQIKARRLLDLSAEEMEAGDQSVSWR